MIEVTEEEESSEDEEAAEGMIREEEDQLKTSWRPTGREQIRN